VVLATVTACESSEYFPQRMLETEGVRRRRESQGEICIYPNAQWVFAAELIKGAGREEEGQGGGKRGEGTGRRRRVSA